MAFGMNTGFALNPARDFGPRLLTLCAGERGGDGGVDVCAEDAARDVDAEEDADFPSEAERGVVSLNAVAERDLCDGSVSE
ncbi:unnamed protein product [Phytophthora lilii]|uniref:Unnamed protein product n=1 Tax=Phytophthora lilii TaxID=2077276 RepID=A0A9W6XSV6_9STRA|nr:unnamed protein product [Phytophthora lilii]